MSVGTTLLGLLESGPRHGYDLKHSYDTQFGQGRALHYGQVLLLAVLTGTALSTILQAAAGTPVRFDWLGIGATSGAAALVVLLTTAAGLPLLRRLTRPGGLRSE